MQPSGLARRILSGLLFGVLVFVVLALVGDLRQVRLQALRFQWGYYPVVLGLTLFNYTLRFVKFHFYLGQVGVRHFSLRESARLFIAGFPLAVTPGKVGEVLKAIWIQQKTGLPVPKGVAVVVAERISDGLAVLILSSLGVIAYPRYWPAFAAMMAVLLGLMILSQIQPLAMYLLGIGERLPVVQRFAHLLHEFYQGSFSLFRPTATLTAVGLGTISWLGEGIGFYLILLGLGISPGWNTLSLAVFTLAFATAVGGASTLPGGLGASEATIAGMLVLLLDSGADIAALATLLIRFATLWFGISLGLTAWIFSRDLMGGITHEPASG